jgi:general secretion pathway protein D
LTYISSVEFLDQLKKLLAEEGISLGPEQPLNIVPLDRLGAVVIFAVDEKIVERVEFWAKQLDRPGEGADRRYYVYQPKFSRATDLGESIAPLIGASVAGIGNRSRDTRSAGGTAITNENVLRRDGGSGSAPQTPMSIEGADISLSIDPRSNSLVFFTTGPKYQAILPAIRRLDVPPKQILLEATIAEVTMTGEFANGVEFAFSDGKFSGGTTGGIGLPAGGLGVLFQQDALQQIRLRLQAGDSRVNLLSKPVLIVRDGVAASINVGNDVPTVGASATDPLQSDKVLTTVLYRNTGLQLSITPTISAQGTVSMQIRQSISNTVPASSGVQGAPIFFTRSVDTEVVAESGRTVLLAGLISESSSSSSTMVPILGRVPLLGNFFRSDNKKRDKTELVLLITPKILDQPGAWGEVMGAMAGALEYLDIGERKAGASDRR